jgi:CRP-like cAMP-binding protein
MTQALPNVLQPNRDGLRERVLALRSQPIFEPVDDEGLLLLAEHARSARYQAGEVVVPAGEPQRGIFVALEGTIEIFSGDRHVFSIPAGTAFGTLALMAREPSALAKAGPGLRTLEVPAAAFETALDENHSLLRSALAFTGSTILRARGNLPLDANVPREIIEGTYFTKPKSMVELLMQLRNGTWSDMNLEALIDLARHMVEVRYPAGHVLWSPGELSTHSIHVDYGRVRCTSPDGRYVDIGREFTLGVLDVWGPRRRAYEARTMTPVIAYRIEFESFLTLLESHVEVGIEILRGFARALLSQRDWK